MRKSAILLTIAILVLLQAASAAQWSIGYWMPWGNVGSPALPISDIDWGALTHVVHYAAMVNADGTLDLNYENLAGTAPEMISTAHANGVKVLMCITQPYWTGQTNNLQSAASGHLSALVSNIVSAVNTYGYDGVDFDWEPFDSGTNGPALLSLANALRAQMGTKVLTTATVVNDYAYWGTAQGPFDRINMMTYDMTGTWNPYSWYNAALYDQDGQVWSVNLSVTRQMNAGVPAAKLGIGIPFYGDQWSGGGVTGPRQHWSGSPSISQAAYTVIQPLISQMTYQWDSQAMVPSLSNSNGWITYDNEQSITEKVNYAKNKNLGGWIIWDLSGDYFPSQNPKHPLAEAIRLAMGGSTGTAPSITTTSPMPAGTVGTAYSQTLAASGSTPLTWTITGGALPGGLSLSSGGVISGTPNASGTFTFTVQAANSAGNASSQFSLTVTAPPVITTSSPLSAETVGTNYSVPLAATGTTPITWTITGGALPAGQTLSSAGVISGTPSASGTFTFTVQAANPAGNNSKQFSLTVSSPVTPPAITSSSPLAGGMAGTAYSQTLTATGTAPITWSVTAGAPPTGLALSSGGVLGGTPSAAGTFTFTVQAANSAGNNSKQFSLTVNSAVVAPAITTTSPLASGTVGTAYSQTLNATGTAPITWSVTGGALPGGLTLSSSGVIGGTPNALGTFTFTVQAANAAGIASAQFSATMAGAAPPSGPYAYWKLNDGAGSVAADSSGNGISASLSSPSWQTGANCETGACLSFNGTNQYGSAALNLSDTSVVTVAFWMNWAAYANDDKLAMELSSNFNNVTTGFMVDPNSSFGGGGQFEVGVHGDGGYNQVTFARPTAGAWHHFAFVFNKGAAAASEMIPYVDGVAVPYTKVTTAENTNNFGADTLFLMSRSGSSLLGAGTLDEVQLYKRALSASEIQTLATPAAPPATPPTITSTSPLAGGMVGTASSQTLTASGTTPITWSVTAGAPPTGLALSSGGVLGGTPSAAGTFTFTVQAANSAGNNSKQFSLTVNPAVVAPAITTTSPLAGGMAGTAYSQTLTATGTAPITWSVTAGAPPTGLALSSGGVLGGTPSAAGTFTFTVQAANSAGNNSKQFSLTVNSAVVAPAITTTSPLASGTVGTAYSQTLNATGTAPITWSVTGGALPGGLTLSSSGVIGGTPNALGTFTFTMQAANAAGIASAQFSATMAGAAPPSGPYAYWKLNDGAGSVAADSSGNGISASLSSPSWQTGANCETGACLSFNGTNQYGSAALNLSDTSVVTVAFWMNWAAYANDDKLAMELSSNFNNVTTGFMVDPNSSFGGGGQFEVGVHGDGGYNQVTFARPTAGAWHHFAFVFNKGAAAASEVIPYVDGVAVPYTKVTTAENTNNFGADTLFLMSRSGPSLLGAGTLDEVQLYKRALSASEIQTLATPAAPPATPPTITSTSPLPLAIVGTAYSQTLTASGTTPMTWTLTAGAAPTGLTLSSAGVISGTPSAPGVYTFTVQAANSAGHASAQFSLTANSGLAPPSGTPPVITTGSTLSGGRSGNAYSETLAATGTTPMTWTVTGGTLPPGLSLASSGVLSGTPARSATYNFTVTATNSAGSNSKAFSLRIK